MPQFPNLSTLIIIISRRLAVASASMGCPENYVPRAPGVVPGVQEGDTQCRFFLLNYWPAYFRHYSRAQPGFQDKSSHPCLPRKRIGSGVLVEPTLGPRGPGPGTWGSLGVYGQTSCCFCSPLAWTLRLMLHLGILPSISPFTLSG